MARIANQVKGALTLACSVATSVSFGFASRRFDQPAGKWIMSACVGSAFFVTQLGLIFTKSKEEAELAEFKRIQSAQNENSAVALETRTRIMQATSDRIVHSIQSGKLEDAERLTDFLKDNHGK